MSALHLPEMLDAAETPGEQPRTYPDIGVRIPQIYLPRPDVDLSKWAVVACDQYTSEPEYWKQVERIVGDSPSTLNLTLPEIFLGKPGEAERIQSIQACMRQYLEEQVLVPSTGLMYVERKTGDHKVRKGLILCLDLEKYDYSKGSQSLIRATEGTIVDRLPPRMKIREGAALEFPHILVLIDDPERTVIEPLAQMKDRLVWRYDFELMMDGGHLTGYGIQDPELEAGVIQALQKLADPAVFNSKYGLEGEQSVLLFAMGDGNHSLATAKAIWEKIKPQVGMDHPARYALVEIENVHDEGLEFEPIHRVLFGLQEDILAALKDFFGEDFCYHPCADCVEMMDWVRHVEPGKQAIGLTRAHEYGVIEIANPSCNLAVGTIQNFLDKVMAEGRAKAIDYVHGECVICKLTADPRNVGFFLPHMAKSDLFKTVILDGALPRKTFSMGEAREKRYYVEGRRIA